MEDYTHEEQLMINLRAIRIWLSCTSNWRATIISQKARYKPHLSLNLHRHLKIWNGSTLTASSEPTSCSWKNLVLATLISIILPFFRHKWAPLLALKKEVVMVVDTIDVVTEVVEKVAEGGGGEHYLFDFRPF
ncbi:hypothetical protein Syun_006391 [Stephania yunnanensis]|uniref:Uncharacterized protein n=1 Tax=Stephania yunnanensis TaxID=152371 RepID=A0AAP0KZ51_9MAGN